MSLPRSKWQRYRLRQGRGEAVLRVTVDERALITALLDAEWLDERAAADRCRVERAAAAIVREWVARWTKNRNR